MNTEHQMKMCFDDEYSKKYNEYLEFKKMLREIQIDYFREKPIEKVFTSLYVCVMSQILFKNFLVGFIIAPVMYYLISSFVCMGMCLNKRIELGLNNKFSLCLLRLKSALKWV